MSILTLTFLIVYSTVFDSKVSLVGDNASYYILAKSVANGDGYKNIHHSEKEPHIHYPPGYPVIVAGVIAMFSDDIVNVKILNGVLLFGAVILLFFIIKQITQNSHIAFASCFILLLNYHVLTYSTIMMSEMTFMFFSFICIWLFLRLDFSVPIGKNYRFWILVIALSFAFYTRSVALALFVSIAISLFLRKEWRYFGSLIFGFMMLQIPWMIRNSDLPKNSYIHQLSLKNPYQPELGTMNFSDLLERIWLNLERYITKEIPSGVLQTTEIVYVEGATIEQWSLGLFLISIALFGLFRLQKAKVFIALYMLAFFGLLILWPHVWYGTRFLVPLIPLILFLAVFGISEFLKIVKLKFFRKLQQYIPSVLFILLLLVWSCCYGYYSINKLRDNAEGVYSNNYQNYFDLAEWVNKNTPENSITCARKDGLFYLFSRKHVTGYKNTDDREAQIEFLKRKNVDYVVVEQLGYSSTSKYLVPAIDRYPNKFKVIKELKHPNTYLMKFLPDLGYSGSWKNEKRDGLGTYVWEDGQKYVGLWKDDVRHGEGVIFLGNGENLSGVWENGKLNGLVIKKDKNGNTIEKSMYENNKKVQVIDEND